VPRARVLAAASLALGIGAIGSQARAQQATQSTQAETQAPTTQPASSANQEPAPSANVLAAREHFDRGEGLFRRQNYAAAVAEFNEAYRLLEGNPHQYTVLYNRGQCNERLFRYDAALNDYTEYLREGGADAPDRAAVEATIRALEGLLAVVHVTTNVPSAEVWVDQRVVGTAPGDLRIPGGRHTIELRAQGYAPAQCEIEVPARSRQDVALNLERLNANRGISPVFFWGASAVAVAAALVGGGFGIAAIATSNDVHARLMDPVLKFGVTEDDRGNIQRLALTADILYASAALFAVGAGVLFFVTDRGGNRHEHAPTHARLAPSLRAGGAELQLVGTF
jgi:tetratricopeptide (TPR) repeat protein